MKFSNLLNIPQLITKWWNLTSNPGDLFLIFSLNHYIALPYIAYGSGFQIADFPLQVFPSALPEMVWAWCGNQKLQFNKYSKWLWRRLSLGHIWRNIPLKHRLVIFSNSRLLGCILVTLIGIVKRVIYIDRNTKTGVLQSFPASSQPSTRHLCTYINFQKVRAWIKTWPATSGRKFLVPSLCCF